MEHPGIGSAVRFGEFRLDLEVGELRGKDDELVPLRPKATAVLVELVEAADKLVPHEKLLDAGWGDAYVEEDSALHKAIGDIRQALDDSATDPRFVATVHRRGYRFIAEVRPDLTTASLAARFRRELSNTSAVKLVGFVALLAVAVAGLAASTSMRIGPESEPSILTASKDVLRARYLLEAGNANAISRGAAMLRDAVVRDDRSPFAWSGLAVAELRLGAYDRAREAALRALELRPLDADARRVLGQCALIDGDFQQAESELLLALEIDPSSGRAHHAYAYFLMDAGRIEEAIAMAGTAASLTPANPVVHANLARYLFYAGRFEEAIERARQLEEFDEPLRTVRLSFLETLQAAAWQLDRHGVAREAAAEYAALSGAGEPVVASFRALPARQGAEAALWWQVDRQLDHESVPPSYRIRAAVILAQLGEMDQARAQLAAARDDPSSSAWQTARLDPRLAPLRDSLPSSGDRGTG